MTPTTSPSPAALQTTAGRRRDRPACCADSANATVSGDTAGAVHVFASRRRCARSTGDGPLPTAAVAEILADVGFDWLFIDGEHGLLETREILAIMQAVGHRIACVVRVTGAEMTALAAAAATATVIIEPEKRSSMIVSFSTRVPPALNKLNTTPISRASERRA